MNPPLIVNFMTAGLTPGDALSNYLISAARILRQWGARVTIYADHIAPQYGAMAQHSHFYQDTGQGILWFFYSLYSPNVEIALASRDYKMMDYHGISPPRLFTGQNPQLEMACQQGIDLLPDLGDKFDQYIVHTEYIRSQLQDLGYPPEKIHKIFYCVDNAVFDGAHDAELVAQLSQMTYFLLVGRIVPQKDVLSLLEIFAGINRVKPDTVLILVGNREQTPQYQRQIDDLIAAKGITNRVMFTGQVNNPAVLAALFQQAKLLFVTSEWESFCVPIAESLYFGVPVAVTDTPPMPEVAGPAGVVFDKQKVAAAVAQRGSNFTIRKFGGTPTSILELIEFGTLDYTMAAYLSFMLEEGMNLFVVGATASGKTTTLNALNTFVMPDAKIVTIEDTPEVQVPHKNWIREVTREMNQDNAGGSVGMFDLLRAALRQRPDRIIVGEIRGEEGRIAFQAMQTGHGVMATFHAASVEKLIQRLTGDPISVPKTYIDNLNIAIIQAAVRLPNKRMVRRILSINEIVGYDSYSESFSFLEAFRWNPRTDTYDFPGFMNSFLLEERISTRRGIPPHKRKQIYTELNRRAKVFERLHKGKGVKAFYDFFNILAEAHRQKLL
jgi:type IV secretory pathway ATPase VirB11/archaellum biosynthesis ATPase